jgi:hypothetical protein
MNYYNFYPTIERIITKDIWTKKDSETNLNINLDLNKLIQNTKIIIINNHNILDYDPKNTAFYLTVKEFGFDILIYDKYLKYNKNNLYQDIINNNDNNDNNINYFIIDNKNNPYTNLNISINNFFNHLNHLPENYDLCYLGNDNNKFKIISQKTLIYYKVKKYFFRGNKNYIISKNGAQKIINYLKNNVVYSSEELFYNCYENIEEFNFYVSKNKLF